MERISAGAKWRVAERKWPVASGQWLDKGGDSFGVHSQIASRRQPNSLRSTAYRLSIHTPHWDDLLLNGAL